jgi:HEAT repeat protein
MERLEGTKARELILEGKWEEVATLGENAVEALLEALEDQEPEVRRGAAWALGVIRNPRAVEPLVSRLRDADESVRSGAAWALGVIGDPRGVPALVDALRDSSPEVRRKAAWALGEIGEREAVDALVQVLEDEDLDVRRVTFLVLEKLGWKPTEEEEVRRLIAEREWDRLAGMGDVAVESLIEALSAEDGETRMKAAWALGEIGDRRALEPLLDVLEDLEPQVREKAARSLGKLRDPGALEGLLRLLDDEDEGVRAAASEALGELGWKPEEVAAEETEELVVAEAKEVVSVAEEEAAVEEMEEVTISSEVGPAAEVVGEGEPPREEATVEEVLGATELTREVEVPAGEPVAVSAPQETGVEKLEEAEAPLEEILLPAVGKEEAVLSGASEEKPLEEIPVGAMSSHAEALIAQRSWKELLALGEEAVLPLAEVLRSGEKGERKKAAFILRQIGLPAVPTLRNLLHDRKEEVRAVARDILAELGWKTGEEEELAQSLIREGKWEEVAHLGKPAVLPLVRTLRDAEVEKRRMAASLLGNLPDAAALEPLLSALQDEDGAVRGRAARALGKLGDARACRHLAEALSDEDADVRARVAASLDRLGWTPADDRERARYFMATRQWNKLAEMAEAAEEALRERLEDADPEVREMARCLLDDIRGSREFKELLRELD